MTFLLLYLLFFLIVFIFPNYLTVFLLTLFTFVYAYIANLYPWAIANLLWFACLLQFISTILLIIRRIKKENNKLFYLYLVKGFLIFSFLCFVSLEEYYLSITKKSLLYQYQIPIKYLFSLIFGFAIGTILKTSNDFFKVNKNVSIFLILFLIFIVVFFNIVYDAIGLSPIPYLSFYLIFTGIGFMIGNWIIE